LAASQVLNQSGDASRHRPIFLATKRHKKHKRVAEINGVDFLQPFCAFCALLWLPLLFAAHPILAPELLGYKARIL
jgi:hypothetical protein